MKKTKKSNKEWKKQLPEESYRVTRLKQTEKPFSGKYNKHKKQGIYHCICCGISLFDSSTKFYSGAGWPSFYDAIKNNIYIQDDFSYNMLRKEVLCKNCDAHLGHVFPDGPKPTTLRYCINSASLDFKET